MGLKRHDDLNRQSRVPERSASFYAAIESAQTHLEACTVALESLLAEAACRDIAQFGAVRLRLAHANLTRTRIALEACKYLIQTTLAESSHYLIGLEQRETDHFQIISGQIQRWTTDAIQHDWQGYRDATRKLLERTRELVAIEKRLLLPLLRQAH